jgi:hypothetical protein
MEHPCKLGKTSQMTGVAKVMASVFICVSTCCAEEQFTDDFQDSRPGELGENWEVSGKVFLHDNRAVTHFPEESIALVRNVTLANGFKIEADFFTQVNDSSGGIVFNYVRTGNFDVLRFAFSGDSEPKWWQFLRFVDGESSVIASGSLSAEVAPVNEWRHLKVYSIDGDGAYAFEISDNSGGYVYLNRTFQDPEGKKPSGKGGFYFGAAFVEADNFVLVTGKDAYSRNDVRGPQIVTSVPICPAEWPPGIQKPRGQAHQYFATSHRELL